MRIGARKKSETDERRGRGHRGRACGVKYLNIRKGSRACKSVTDAFSMKHSEI
jgi:hypothetical protein